MEPLSFDQFRNVIDGKLVDSETTRHGINPATLEALPPVPNSTPKDVDAAVAAAKKAAAGWADTPLAERQQAVSKYADALAANAEAFAKMLVLEQGKPVGDENIPASYFNSLSDVFQAGRCNGRDPHNCWASEGRYGTSFSRTSG